MEVFADRFDREIADVFALQDDIVDSIVARLFFNLRNVAAEERSKNSTQGLTAYTFWLRARAEPRKGDEDAAREELHRAIKVDENYGPALAVLGLLYSYLRFSHADQLLDEERKKKSLSFASRAIAAEKNDPFILSTFASTNLLNGHVAEALRFSNAATALSHRQAVSRMRQKPPSNSFSEAFRV